ncbi:HEAT repeat domain-containing protein [Crocosphaera sp. XPORK-15E]|uniref:HEAT repeat domain-containing protein n=1 Tax=Crocosphaera sp. XPORK-15E TaxID=3110247 RepID=UPI002B21F5DB|nr:HEAT repeat domain-containing protein [Crocosphaera sp. XPORK-15E]MEA5534305.1 HEAT repeat domain-containing protein [Crocosphaera sp. XPORK-15E]
MINYRLSLLVIICLTALGWAPDSNARVFLLNQSATERKVETVAQAPATEASKPSQYNPLMQAGYQATREKNYQKAKEQFTKALQARPNDIYAQQALQNVEFYLAKQANPLSNLTTNWIWLLLGLVIITGGFGLVFWLFFRRPSTYPKEKFEDELLTSQKDEEYLEPVLKAPEQSSIKEPIISNQEDEEYFEPVLKDQEKSSIKEPIISNNNGLKPIILSESSADEGQLKIQATSRISSLDAVEILIDYLQETDPKKRRKAIWGLAQKADSRAMKPLVDLMIDTDSQERSLILEALSQISARTLRPMNQALSISLQDKNPQVRKNAIRDLTRIYELMSQISQLLCHAIDDKDREVQDTAKWAINQLNTQMTPRLDMLTRDLKPEVTVEQSYSDSIEEI